MMIGKLINVMANIEYGILIAVVLDIILLVAIAVLNDKCRLNALSYIIAAIIVVPIALLMSQLIGACTFSNATAAIKNIVGAVSPTLSQYVPSASRHNMGWFIFFRIFWSLLCLVIGGCIIYITMDKKKGRRIPSTGIQTGRRYTSNISRRRR